MFDLVQIPVDWTMFAMYELDKRKRDEKKRLNLNVQSISVEFFWLFAWKHVVMLFNFEITLCLFNFFSRSPYRFFFSIFRNSCISILLHILQLKKMCTFFLLRCWGISNWKQCLDIVKHKQLVWSTEGVFDVFGVCVCAMWT